MNNYAKSGFLCGFRIRWHLFLVVFLSSPRILARSSTVIKYNPPVL